MRKPRILVAAVCCGCALVVAATAETLWIQGASELATVLADAQLTTIRTLSDFVDPHISARSSRMAREHELASPPVRADLALPRSADLVMFDMRSGVQQEVQSFDFLETKWYPYRMDGDTVFLASMRAQAGTRPSAQQKRNLASKDANEAKRAHLQSRLADNLAATAVSTSNVTEVGRLYLERQALQNELDKSLSLARSHKDSVVVHELLQLSRGVNIFPPSTILWVGPRPSALPRVYQVVIVPEDPSAPMSEF